MNDTKPVIAVIGGTGALGTGLSHRWAKAGYPLVIGSRSAERAVEAAAALEVPSGVSKPRGMMNADAASVGEVVVMTVPFKSHAAILDEIAEAVRGKIVVDTTVPFVPPKVARVQLPPDDSAAISAQKRLGNGTRVVAAFHNVAAHKLQIDVEIDCDVLVFGESPEDRDVVIGLAEAARLRGLHGGPLANSAAAEAMTSVLIGINKRYKVDGAGLRITGIGATG